MRRLRDFQLVRLQVGAVVTLCQVVARQDDEAVLRPTEAHRLRRLMAAGEATLSFELKGHVVSLSGIAGPGPIAGTARFVAADTMSHAEPRHAPRMPLRVAAVVRVEGEPVPAGAWTVDVSRSGVLLDGWTAPQGTVVRVVLTLPGADERLELDGRVARSEPGRAAVSFVQHSDVVDDFVLRCRGMLAEHLAEQPARRTAAGPAH